jgi:hypothetical protein
MLQAAAVHDHPVQQSLASGRMSLSPLARLLLVAGVVGVIGVTIDLSRGTSANAVPAPGAQGPALAALPIDHSVLKAIIDGVSLDPGASVAAYETWVDDSVAQSAKQDPTDDEPLESGASIAAY